MYIICNKVKFITNITNVTEIHTFYFYNNRHTCIITDTTFTTKHTYFIKINTSPVAGPKWDLCFVENFFSVYKHIVSHLNLA